jgi:hypothetical protein
MSEELERLHREHDKLAAENEASYRQLQKEVPGIEMNAGDARLQCLIDALSASVWTQEDRLRFEISFHKKIEETLSTAGEQVREKKKGRLIVPRQRNGLIVPGN